MKQYCQSCGKETEHSQDRFKDIANIQNDKRDTYLTLWVAYCEECLTVDDNNTWVE